MNYLQFKKCVLDQLKDMFPKEEYDIDLRLICKNNGLRRDGISIFKKGENISPTIYLDPYYERYLEGKTISDIVVLITGEYYAGMEYKPKFNCDCNYYETVNQQVILRLVNYEKNKEILEDCPYIPFHDLAITFRWIAYQDEIGISTALISNQELKHWCVTVSQLFKDAINNTQRLFPAKIQRLKDMLKAQNMDIEEGDFELYVLTNEQGINGASCILYERLLKEFGQSQKSNFYLLPSSIHEMMICLDDPLISSSMLLSLVKDANHMVVTMGEVLSDNIYYYDYEKEVLTLIEPD